MSNTWYHIAIVRSRGLNKQKLIKRLHKRLKGFDLKDVKHIANSLFYEMNQAFFNHERIEIKNFGVFTTYKKKRYGRNFNQNKPIYFKDPKEYTVKFKLGSKVKRLLND